MKTSMKFLRLFAVIFLVLGIYLVTGPERGGQAFGQVRSRMPNKSEFRFPILHRPYGISNQNVDGFESFQWVYIVFRKGEDRTNALVDSKGRVMVDGFIQLKDGKKFAFRTASLRRDGNYFKYLSVATESIDGIHYELDGCFFEKPQFRGSYYVDMSGQLRKFASNALLVGRDFEFFDVSDE